MTGRQRSARRWAVLCAVAIVLVAPSTAGAETTPPRGTPATVSGDPLPTWQVDGIVWSQVVVGRTVYVTGRFTRARPPGVPLGGRGEVAARNLFAYDITTGNRVPTFSHALNAQGRVITRSPDGTRIYVGGDFTTVDGVAAGHVAAFSTATGALDRRFRVSVNSTVRALAASPTALYLGGAFRTVNGAGRAGLAAVRAGNGALLPWRPRAEGGSVQAMVLAPDRSRVVVGGSFVRLSGVAAYGMGSLHASTGRVLPWAANRTIRNAGRSAAITSLRTDGRRIYGSGYQFLSGGGGNFEGTFSADPTTGAIVVVNDCHGDTYDVAPIGAVLYSVGHAHDCSWIGSFPTLTPRVRQQRALAQTTAATRRNLGPDDNGWDYRGLPASTVLHWFPQLTIGTASGQQQAAWSVTGTASYVALGGEFLSVDGVPQQGLVRFVVRAGAPNRRGPTYAVLPARPTPPTVATRVAAGSIAVRFGTAWDTDNSVLTYQVVRDGVTVVHTRRVRTTFWSVPTQRFTDTGLRPGTSHTYSVRITDPFGNRLVSPRSARVTA